MSTKSSKKSATKRKVVEVETEKKYAFKIFKRIGDKLHSASVPQESKLHMVYVEGKPSKVSDVLFEAGFGVCCFMTPAEALAWRGAYYEYELWKVEVGLLKAPAAARPSINSLANILPVERKKDSYKKVLNVINKHPERSYWPTGCVMADYVVPVERVK
jgi:hypothetical protein